MGGKILSLGVLTLALALTGCTENPQEEGAGVPYGEVSYDLDCDDIPETNIDVSAGDPHGFDGYDNDGVGCED